VTILHLDAEEVHRRLPILAAIEALEEALRAGPDPEAELPRTIVEVKRGALHAMPSAAAAHPVVKLVTIGGRPRVQGVSIAFDGETLAPQAIVDGIAVTTLRTSAVSALAVRHLAAQQARRLLVLGRAPGAGSCRSHARRASDRARQRARPRRREPRGRSCGRRGHHLLLHDRAGAALRYARPATSSSPFAPAHCVPRSSFPSPRSSGAKARQRPSAHGCSRARAWRGRTR
jgi:hypothetical protein